MRANRMWLVSALAVCSAFGQSFSERLIHPGNGVSTNVPPVDGAVSVLVNSGASGGGIVTLDPASGYYGSTSVGCGTLVVTKLADGGKASSVGASPASFGNLTLGLGTLRYTGTTVTNNRALKVSVPDGKSAVFEADGDVAFTGAVSMPSGAFFKTGPGTLAFFGAGTNTLPNVSSPVAQDDLVNLSANGDAPTKGLGSLTVLEGTVAWGAPGQTMIINGTDALIGSYTTTAAGQEKPGYVDIYGGSTFFNCWLAIGRHNGTLTTAPTALESRVRVFGGTVEITHLTMGRNKKGYGSFKYHARPTLEVLGGEVKVNSTCRLGDDQGGDTVVRVLGGSFTSTPLCQFGALAGRSTNRLEIANGGLFTAAEMNLAAVGADTDTTLDVRNGGILSPTRIYASTGATRVRFDGGIYRPRFTGSRSTAEATVDAIYLSTNGLLVDVTSAASVLDVSAPILAAPDLAGAPDGGLTLTGNTNGRLDLGGANAYTGPTVISNGVLGVRGSLPVATALTILPGGGFAITNATQAVTVGTLAVGSSSKFGSVDFHMGAEAGVSARLVVTGAVTATDPVSFKLSLVQPGTTNAVTAEGTYTFLQLPAAYAGAIDPARFVIANPASGKRYAITSETSGADAFYRVTVSSGAASGDVWTRAEGGAWQTAGNWSGGTPPNGPFASAAFTTEARAGGAEVTLSAPVTVGAVALASSAPYVFTGAGLTFDGGALGATWSVTLGSHTLAAPVALASPLSIATVAGATQTVAGAVAAPQALSVNPAASGSGTVRFTGENALTGPFAVGSGTASFEGAAAIDGLAAPVIGAGTLRYSGEALDMAGLTLAPGPSRAAILKNEGDLTVTAPVLCASGGFIKSGAGTLTLDGVGSFALGVQNVSTPHDFAGYPVNGDSPTSGFGSLVVSQGKLAWGDSGQTVTVGSHLHIGARNANGPGEAVTGELEINGGAASVSGNLYIGVANGDPVSAPAPLHPRLTVNGGDTAVSGELIMGWDNRTTTAAYIGTQQAQNTQPEMVLNGGVLRLSGGFYPSYHGGVSPTNRVTINGGELSAKWVYFGASWFGDNLVPAATVLFEMNGGSLILQEDFRTARYGADSYFRFDGGVLRAWDIQKADGGGNSEVWLNGGVFQPIYGGQSTVYRTFDRHTNAWVSAGGFIIDTSFLADVDPAYEISQAMRHDAALGDAPDGGIVKRGRSGLLIIRPLAAGQRYSFTGPVTAEEGVLGIDRQALWENRVVLCEGATLRLSNKDSVQIVDAFTAGTNSAGTGRVTLDLSFETGTNKSQPLVVSNALSLMADVEVSGHVDGGYTPTMPAASAVTVLVCKADQTLDAATFKTSSLFPNRSATFQKVTLAGGPYSGWQAIVMAISDQAAAAAAVWGAQASGGAWEMSGNWLANAVPPSLASQQALFTNAASAAVPVTLADEKMLGQLTLMSGGGLGYALSGGALTLAELCQTTPKISVLSGTHAIVSPLRGDQEFCLETRSNATLTVAGPVSGSGKLLVNPASSGGGLTVLSDANAHTGGTDVRSGTLRVSDLAALGAPAFAANNLQVGPGTLHYTGPAAATDLGLRFASGTAGRPAILRLDSDLTLTGPASLTNGIFAKFGPGTLRLASPGTNQFTTSTGGDANSTAVWPANGDAPAVASGGSTRSFIDEGKFVVGGPGQAFIFKDELDIGSQDRGLGDYAHEASMDVIGGTVAVNGYFGLGVNFKRETGTSTYSTLNIYDGDMSVGYLTMAYDAIWKAHSTKAVLNLYGGSFSVANQFRLGHHKGNAANPPMATINVYGGSVNHAHASEGTTFGWYNSGDPKPACSGTLNLFGGAFNERWILKMANSDSKSWLNLHGGTLRAENITHVAGSVGASHVYFNGGVYQPMGSNAAQRVLQGLTEAVVSTNGAIFDTSYLAAGAIYTNAQVLAHDPALGALPDGGLTKRGAGTLTLSASNTFAGPVTVEQGVLRLAHAAAVPDLVVVSSNGVLDADGAVRTVPRLSGAGTCVNGTVRVAAQVSPGMPGNATPGATLSLANLTLAPGAAFVCHTTASGLPGSTNDVLAVSGTLAAEGGGFIDFGRTADDPVGFPYSAVVMTFGTCNTGFSGWKVRNTGYPDGLYALRVTRDDVAHTVRAELVQNGTIMLLN